jgi:Glycosyltransferase like family
MEWTLISATNSDEVLKSSLLSSPDIGGASEVILQRGYTGAAACYNSGLGKAKTDLVVFAHQDMYFPRGWIDSLRGALDLLSVSDPNWGVLGVWGDRYTGGPPGYLYWTGVDGTAGQPFDGVREVRVLDEIVLIVRKSSGLSFDERLPGFHMYGTDICLEARRRGRKCYVFSGFCVHNTNVYDMLPWEFWKSYLFMRRKWKSELPISTPCIDITWSCWPMIRWNIVRAANIMLRRHKPGKRVADPAAVYQDLVNRGLVAAFAYDGAGPGESDIILRADVRPAQTAAIHRNEGHR